MLKNVKVENEERVYIHKKEVHSIISKLKKELKFSISFLQINFVSSQHIIELNKKYLEHKGSTDIITFNYSSQSFNLDGECYICIDEAKQNAKNYKVSIQNELLRLIIHGILHLLGYDDIKKEDRTEMKKVENRLVDLLYNKKLIIAEVND